MCDDYVVDVLAPKFGTCKCGAPKAAHTIGPGPKRPPTHSATRSTAALASLEDEAAAAATRVDCPAFSLDVAASTFGACSCGAPKAAHSAAALAAGAAAAKGGSVVGLRKSALSATAGDLGLLDTANCAHFEVAGRLASAVPPQRTICVVSLP